MKNIITAMISEKLNIELKKEKDFKVICNNIQYREAIIDIINLKRKNNLSIDILILDEQLPGEIELEELILNIRKINNKIKIIILSKDKYSEIKEEIKNLKIKNIYYQDKINIEKIISELKEENHKKINVKKYENKKVENRISNENLELNNYSIFQDNKNKEINNREKNIYKNSLILIGNNEKIKERFIYQFNKIKNIKKILIINFNIINYKNKYVKLNNYVDVIFWRNKIYKNNFDFNIELNKLMKKYNFIFLDFEINNFFIIQNKFINNQNIVLFLENSINQIKLNYKKINKINNKIKIILNVENKFNINKNIIKIIFRKFKIIGEINLFNKNKIEKSINKIIIKLIKN